MENQYDVHLEGMLVVDAHVTVEANSFEEAVERAQQRVKVRDEPDPFPACGVDRLADYEEDTLFEGPDDPTYIHYIQPVSAENLTTGDEWRSPPVQERPDMVQLTLPRERVQLLLTMLAYHDELGARLDDERFNDQQEWINDRMNEQITALGEVVQTIQGRLEATGVGPKPELLKQAMDALKRNLEGPITFKMEEPHREADL